MHLLPERVAAEVLTRRKSSLSPSSHFLWHDCCKATSDVFPHMVLFVHPVTLTRGHGLGVIQNGTQPLNSLPPSHTYKHTHKHTYTQTHAHTLIPCVELLALPRPSDTGLGPVFSDMTSQTKGQGLWPHKHWPSVYDLTNAGPVFVTSQMGVFLVAQCRKPLLLFKRVIFSEY